jgi:hypothetical protein
MRQTLLIWDVAISFRAMLMIIALCGISAVMSAFALGMY